MYFSIITTDNLMYEEARSFFLSQWRSDLLSRAPSSLVWAYLVTKYMWDHWKSHFSFMHWVYSCEELYFSTSHSEDLLVIAVDPKRVAVDLEYIRPRDESLLKEVHVPDSPFWPWENFYLQWCAKECLIKYHGLQHEQMHEIQVNAYVWNQHLAVQWWEFDSLLLISHRWKEYAVHTVNRDWKVLALLHKDWVWYWSF